MNINLFESIRIFIEIVESGSLSRAAQNLQIHRPAVTKALQLLEQHSGTRLLQRTTRRISLTPDGDAFYRRSKPLRCGGYRICLIFIVSILRSTSF